MPTVKFTYALRRFFPGLQDTRVQSTSLPGLLEAIEHRYPGIRGYLLDEQGALRRHVNIFIDGRPIQDRITLGDPLKDDSEIHIMQALSGG